jgi:hypothetical protein
LGHFQEHNKTQLTSQYDRCKSVLFVSFKFTFLIRVRGFHCNDRTAVYWNVTTYILVDGYRNVYHNIYIYGIIHQITVIFSQIPLKAVIYRTSISHSFIHSSIHQWLYSLLLGPGLFFSFVIFFTQTVGLLGRGISPSQSRYLHTDQNKQNKRTYKHPCLEWDSNPRSQRSSERRQFMPWTARQM